VLRYVQMISTIGTITLAVVELATTTLVFVNIVSVSSIYDFRIKTMFGTSLPPVVCRRTRVFAHSGIQHICFVFHHLVYPLLPISVDCLFLIVP
jgi:hypothetical protein